MSLHIPKAEMIMIMKKVVVLFSLFCCLLAGAEVQLATPFADGMALQRERPVPVWGSADAGAAVAAVNGGEPPARRLVWSDEFDGTALDPAKWGYELGFIRNREYQYDRKGDRPLCGSEIGED